MRNAGGDVEDRFSLNTFGALLAPCLPRETGSMYRAELLPVIVPPLVLADDEEDVRSLMNNRASPSGFIDVPIPLDTHELLENVRRGPP